MIRLVVRADGQPVPHGLFEVVLSMRRKNSYRLLLGPADEAGRLDVSRSQLEAETRRENDLFPMDYVGLSEGWTGEIKIRPVAVHDLKRLREGFAIWRESGSFPEDYAEQLDHLERSLAKWPATARLTVEFAVEPKGIADVEVIDQRVNASLDEG